MFENIGKKIVGVGKGVMRGTQTFSETVSLNARIDECRKNLNNCYSQLGQAYYTRAQGNVPPEFKGIFDQIQMLNQNIIQLQEQIKIVKGIRQCPNCGAEVGSNVMFCGNCGYSMPPVQAGMSGNGPACPSCGAPLEEGAAFCTNCGAKAVRPEQPAAGYQSAPVPQPEPAAPEKTCPNCGAPAAADAAFCNECGSSLLAGEKPQDTYSYQEPEPVQNTETIQEPFASAESYRTEEPADMGQPGENFGMPSFQQPEGMMSGNAGGGRVCPNCGTHLEPDAVFCSECGSRVG